MNNQKVLFCFLFMFFVCSNLFSQTPGGINYQGMARNQFLVGLNNDSIQLRFTIKEKTANGASIYTETRGTRTDSFGVFNVVIGSGGALSQSGNIKLVKWSDTTKKFLQVELNIDPVFNPAFLNMGTTQLLSVPFSFYSDVSDSARIAAKADSAKFSNGSGRYFFSATIPGDTYQTIPNDAAFTYVVKFPTVLQNEGNVFNPATSVFTAPDSGYYQFNISGFRLLENNYPTNDTNWNQSATAVLMKNNTIVKVLHDELHSFNGFEHTNDGPAYFNTTVMLKLAKNDQVSIRLNVYYQSFASFKLGWSISNYSEFNVDGRGLAEFSGYKIK